MNWIQMKALGAVRMEMELNFIFLRRFKVQFDLKVARQAMFQTF